MKEHQPRQDAEDAREQNRRETSVGISTVDMDGVALAAIKALEERTAAQQQRIGRLEEELRLLEALLLQKEQ